MAIEILGAAEVAAMRRAGRAAAATLAVVGARLSAGMSTADIDAWVRADTSRRGGRPSQLGFHGFPAAVCTSRNDVVCHGIPEPARTPGAGRHHQRRRHHRARRLSRRHLGDVLRRRRPAPEARHVVEVARRCRDAGIAEVRDGARLGDIGAAIEELAAREGCSVVRELRRARHRPRRCTRRRTVSTSGHAATGAAPARGHGLHHRADDQPGRPRRAGSSTTGGPS